MRRFIALFVFLGAALLAAPGIIGHQVETYYQGVIQQFGQGSVQLVSQEYQRGWFGAESQTGFVVTIPAGPDRHHQAETFHFTLISHIAHGPLTTQGLKLAEIQSEIRVDDKALLPADYQAVINTYIALSGEGVTQVNLPKTELPAVGERPAVRFDGMQGEMWFDANLEQVTTQFSLPALTLTEPGKQRLEIEGVRFNSHSSKGVAGLMLGGGEFIIDRMALQDQETGTGMDLAQLGIEVESRTEGESVSIAVRYRLETLNVNESHYGPAEIRLSLGNLAPAVLAEIQRSVEEINAQPLSEEQRGMALVSVLMGNAPGLLKGNPVVTIDKLRVQTPDGLIDGMLSLQVMGLEWKEISNTPVVLSKLVGEASLRMPQRLFRMLMLQKAQVDLLKQFEQRRVVHPESEMPSAQQLAKMSQALAEQQLKVLLSQEFVVTDGEALATQAKLSDGLLSINGKSIPLPVQ